MKNTMKKGMAILLAITMLITQSGVSTSVLAQENMVVRVEQTKDHNIKQLSITTKDVAITKAVLRMNEEQIGEIDLANTKSFDIYTNGTYVINGLDAQGNVIASTTNEVIDFEDISLIAQGNNIQVLSRIKDSAYAQVEGAITKDISFSNVNQLYSSTFEIEKNGTYTVNVYDMNGAVLGSEKIEVTSFTTIKDEGIVELYHANDLTKIVENPSGNFIVKDDITVTSDVLANVTFTGTLDGNGYVIKGFQNTMFQRLEGATIKNITIQGGALATYSKDSQILQSGFYMMHNDDKKDVALLLESENTTIQGCYVLANIEAKNASGFVLQGTATITDSYVSGYLKGKEVYGFGKDVTVHNSYSVASYVGEKRILFTDKEQTDNFYDAQVNDFSDSIATAYTTESLLDETFENKAFHIEKGYYPQIKASEQMKEHAQKISVQSALSVTSKGNLGALEGNAMITYQEGIQWSTKQATQFTNGVSLEGKQGEVLAISEDKDVINRFSLKATSTINTPVAGDATTLESTQITYPTVYGKYYKVLKASDPEPTNPVNHKDAMKSGWKIIYWTGVARETNVSWNTEYVVYESDLTTLTQQEVKTNKGTSTGNIKLTGNYEESETLQASLEGYQVGTTGTLYWEKATTIDATTWTEIKKENITDLTTVSTYKVKAEEEQSYIRVRFEVDANYAYKGTHTAVTSNVLRSAITSVVINKSGTAGIYSVGDKLSSTITPSDKDNEVEYTWYHDGETASFYTGKNYTLNGNDVGKQIKVVATAKENSTLKGAETSALTGKVIAINSNVPTTTATIVSFDDATAVLSMKDDKNALYQFKITNKDTNEEKEYEVYARSNTEVSIIGLSANTNYQILARTIGEDGFLNSDYSTTGATFTTSKQRVQGSVELTGSAIYGKELSVSMISSIPMTGSWKWYRIASDGTKTQLTTSNPEKYKLVKEDIDCHIEAVYVGNGEFAGEVSSKSDVIVKAESDIPTDNATLDTDKTTYNGVTLKMPTNTDNRRYIVGYSASSTGVPIEYQEDGVVVHFEQGSTHVIKGLKKNTEYYFFVRYKDSETYQKSEWVTADKAISETTKKKTLVATIKFQYATEKGKPMKGEEITAELTTADDEFNYNGDWKWYSIEGTTEKEIFNFSIAKDKKSSVFNIPNDVQDGTKYKVVFTPKVGYEGNQEGTSVGVVPFEKQPYATPSKDDIKVQVKSDTTLSIMMNNGEGQYQFRYKKVGDVDYTEINQNAYKYIEVQANDLLRNSKYVVSVKRVGDGSRKESDWSSDTSAKTTEKTELSGYVSITGVALNKGTINVEYVSANYSPRGDDTGGSWKWYRGEDIISGETNDTYTIGDSDVGQTLKVEYTAKTTSDFKGVVQAKSPKIEKAISDKPTATIVNGYDKTNLQLYIDAQITKSNAEQKVFYRLQKAEEATPTYPQTAEDFAYWNEMTSESIKITKDGGGVAFAANGEYTMYMFKTEGDYIQSSGIVSTSFKMGTPVQTGKVTMSGKYIVNETITATLSDENNSKGTWKWYMSNAIQSSSTGTMPDISKPELWTEITSGFTGAINSEKSELKVTADMWGRYLRADFVANEDEGYNGSLSGAGSNSTNEKEYVRRLFEETLKIESSTKDGNGKPKGYSGTKVTATIENSYESVADNNLREKYLMFNTTAYDRLSSASSTNSVYTYTLGNYSGYNGYVAKAEVRGLKRYYLYVDKNQKDYVSSNAIILNSGASTGTSFQYQSGIPISTPNEMANFIKGVSPYSNRSDTFIITSNINMSSQSQVAATKFYGTLDGDYHTISYAKNPLFSVVEGSSSRYAEVKNIIFTNGNISSYPSGAYQTGAISGQIVHYVKINRIFAINTTVVADQNGGLIAGFVGDDKANPDPYASTVMITECGAAGGKITKNTSVGASIGGLAGFAPAGVFQDNFSVANEFAINQSYTVGGFIGHGSRSGGDNIQRNYTTAKFNFSNSVDETGGIIGRYGGSGSSIYNNFYDRQVVNNSAIDTSSQKDGKRGTPKDTSSMIGTGLQGTFGNSLWSYRSGFYPSLKWVKDLPVTELYTATRAAFVSTSGHTNEQERLSGLIYSTLIIPEEFRTKDYKVTSSDSNVLRVVNNSIIVPVGSSGRSATITITYNEPDSTIGGSAKNTFTFTVKNTLPVLSVSISGTPQSGKTLSANVSGDGSTYTYQWYRRKSGESVSEKITGATSSTYTLTTGDIGYEFSVEAKSVNYSETMSVYTSVVTAPSPSKEPTLISKTDSEIKLEQTGLSGVKYDIAYTAGSDTTKNMLPTTYADGAEITLPNLQRNKEYKIYARVTAGTTYNASAWSPALSVTTDKTEVVGSIIMGPNINNGQDLSFTIENTNNQTGTWMLERLPADSTTPVEVINATISTANTFNYRLTSQDVGYRIRATYTGRADFKGELVGSASRVVKKSIAAKPSSVTQVPTPSEDKSLTIKAGISGEKYDIGISDKSSGTPEVSFEKIDGDAEITITGLKRNTTYYVYARGSETDAWVTGPWSDATILTTGKTAVQGAIDVSGSVKVDQEIIFTAPDINGQVGRWKLERKDQDGNFSTISPLAYRVSEDTRSLTYQIQPQDASEGSNINTLQATFNGSDSYSGSIETNTSKLEKAKLTTDGLDAVTVENTSEKDQSLRVKVIDGTDTYQFGYAKTGTSNIKDVASAVNANTEVTIDELTRNTSYDIYIRKAARLGYDASDYVKTTISKKTLQTDLNGTVIFQVEDKNGNPVTSNKVGSAIIGYTYIAEYKKGTYDPNGDDEGGTWQWYADGSLIADATSNSYKVLAMGKTVDITVKYIAKEDSDFKGTREASIGTLEKEDTTTPEAPTVTALTEDKAIGSKLKIKTDASKLEDVYWYVQKASNETVPTTIAQIEVVDSELVKLNKWFKAKEEVTIDVEAHEGYVVYAAKLENNTNVSSGVISQRAVVSAKDDLSKLTGVSLEEVNSDAKWKILQDKGLQVNCDKTVTGTWDYYVVNSPDEERANWQNINLEVQSSFKEGVLEGGKTYSSVQIPLKYREKYVVAVFTGRGAYEGSIVYKADAKAEGTLMKGIAELAISEPAKALDTIKVTYSVLNNPVPDNDNGRWFWYREETKGSGDFEVITDESGQAIGKIGITDEYKLTASDVGKKIYARYTAQVEGNFSGFVQTKVLNSVERADQNKPDKPVLKQVNGTDIQVTLPKNYDMTKGTTIPEVVLGYRKVGDTGEITWQEDQLGESWIRNLNAQVEYEVYARYEETSEYKQSEESEATIIKTKNQLFDENNLKLNVPTTLEPGAKIVATYEGEGYDEGHFVVKRSDGVEVQADTIAMQGKLIEGVVNAKGKTSQKEVKQTRQMTYTCVGSDIGANMIIIFEADSGASHYGGSIAKASEPVQKPENPNTPVVQGLAMITYEETQLSAQVSSDYEYVITTSTDAIVDESDWQKYTTLPSETHTFENLDKSKTYYLHARLAETEVYRHGNEVRCAGTKPWNRKLYAITYNGLENVDADSPVYPNQYTELEEITLENPKKKGYTFEGWTFEGQETPIKPLKIEKHSEGAKSFQANWKINQYVVTFDSDGGSTIRNERIDYNTNVPEPISPNKTGYSFIGWYKDEERTQPWIFSQDKISNSDMTLYAKWEINRYMATFDGNGGNSPESISQEYGKPWGTMKDAKRDGYTFLGWYDAITGGNQVNKDTHVPANNVTYYAHWKVIEYNIDYEANGGSFDTQNPAKYNIETESFSLLPPTKKGNKFLGWTFEGQDIPLESVILQKGSFGDKLFTANWEVISYPIQYDLAGGINNAKNPMQYTVDSEEITLLVPRYEGYVFDGWSGTDITGSSKQVVIAKNSIGDRTFKAHWKVASAVVSFETNGGSNVGNIGAALGQKMDKVEDPQRKGYSFTGWYKESSLTTLWKFDMDVVSGDMTLYAGWIANQYQIEFKDTSTTTKKYGEALGTLPVPTKEGYQFIGWYDENDQKISASTIVKKDEVYTAKWKVVEYQIHYDLDGGTNATSNPNLYTVESADIMLAQPTKENYVFEGWVYDGITTPTKEGKIVAGSKGDKTFSAHWKVSDYNVSFVTNGGSSIPTYFVNANDKIKRPSDPSRTGYIFEGWYKEDTFENVWDFDQDVVKKDTKLYALWTRQQIVITLDEGNGSSSQITGPYGDEIGTLPKVERNGYRFLGWYSKSEGGESIHEQMKLTSDRTIYAHFEAITYFITYDLQQGINANDNPTQYTAETEDIVIANPHKVGYVFEGWSDEKQPIPTVRYVLRKGSTDNRNLVAHWSIADYKISFDTMGGERIEDVYAKVSTLVSQPENPVRDGYKFEGWYQDEAYSVAWNFDSDTVQKDMILYAKWSINMYTIQFNSHGGSLVPARNKAEKEALGELPTTTRKDYKFLGWYTSAEGGEKIDANTIVKGHTTYHARWTPIEYSITYVLHGGTNGNNPTSYHVESDTITLAIPNRKNYAFLGWTYDDQTNPIKEVVIEKGSRGNRIYEAQWASADYKVHFDTLGGNELADFYVVSNGRVDRPEQPKRTGYTFEGWYKEATLTNAWDFETNSVHNDLTLYAKWSINSYEVSFDVHGGSAVGSIMKNYGEVLGALPTTKKEGYTFEGWYTSEQGGSKVDNNTQINETTILHARWSVQTFTIKYLLNGGSNHKDNPMQYNTETETFVLKDAYYKDHAFIGWTYDGQDTPVKEVSIEKGTTKDLIFIANWTTSDSSVTFDTQGGNKIDTYYGLQGERMTRPQAPVKKGYTFYGWYKEASYETLWNFNVDVLRGDITLYANWNINQYTAHFETEGGVGENVEDRILDFNTAIGTLPIVEKTGYEWKGWYTKRVGGEKITSSTKLQEDTTYYAQWNLREYTITYQLQGGTNAESNPKNYTITTPNIRLAKPTRAGYTFTGWTTKDTENPVEEMTIEKGSSGNKIVIANWKAKTYQVHYDSDGGNQIPTKEVTWEDTILPTAQPTKEGYEFIGWLYHDNKVNSSQTYADIAKDDELEGIELKAQWKKNSVPTPIEPVKPTPTPIPTPIEPTKPNPSNSTPEIPKENIPTKGNDTAKNNTGGNKQPDVEVKGELSDGNIRIPATEKGNKGNGKTIINVGEGSIVVQVSSDIEIADMEAFINSVLSEKQKVDASKGSNIEIRVNVEPIKKSAAANIDNIEKTAKDKNLTLGNFYDVNIAVREDENDWIKIKQLKDAVEITLPVEKELQKYDATFYAIREHEGKISVLKDQDKKTKTVTVVTKQFSTYAIAYKMNEKQGTYEIWLLTGTGILIAAGVVIYAKKRKKQA